MNTTRRTLLAAGALSPTVFAPSWAQAADFVEGKDYKTLPQAKGTDDPKRIEVLEFFWYGCPHCYAFEPQLNDWAKKLPKDVYLKRSPAAFRESWMPHQRLYFALEALGEETRLRGKVFDAIHKENKGLDTPEKMVDWLKGQGVDSKKFLDAYNGFSVQSKGSIAVQMQQTYGLEGVPTIAVNGKYITSAAMLGGSHERALQVTEFLIDKERKRK